MKEKVKVGVIRWDAWIGDLNPVGLEVEKCLSLQKYHNRLPFYASFNKNKVNIRNTNEKTILKEIEYASNYEIDYFAFCWYPFGSGLDTARNLFLKVKQSKVKWCLILGTNPFNEKDADWLIKQFSNDNYQKIDNRPVIYLFDVNKDLLDAVNYIKINSKKYKPYFIGMVWNQEQAKNINDLFKLDALTQYCTPGKNNMSYNELSKLEESLWNKYLNINSVVPWVTTGWDKRPRYEYPVSWEKCDNFDIEYIQYPTTTELKEHLNNAYLFNNKCNNGHVLIYAWNEFDEGGFIEPTLKKDGTIDVTKLSIIKEVVNNNKVRLQHEK